MILPHEINALCASFATTQTGAGDLSIGGLFLIDPTKYSGTLSYYIEVLYTNTRTTDQFVYLGANSATSRVTLTASTSTLTLARVQITSVSVLSTISSSNSLFWAASSSVGTVTVKSARIIIVQDTVTDPLMYSESQFEIGNQELAVTVSVTSTLQPLAAPKYWRYTAANYNGTLTFYAECTYLVSSTTGNKTIVVQESSDLSTWATAVTLLNVATGSTTAIRLRSTSFIPKDGYYYRLAWTNSSTMSTASFYNAKIVVDQLGLLTLQENSTDTSSFVSFFGGTGTSSETVQALGQSFIAATSYVCSGVQFYGRTNGTPTDSFFVELVSGSITGSVLGTSLSVSATGISNSVNSWIGFVFPTQIPLTSGTEYWLRIKRTGARDISNCYILYYSTSNPLAGVGRYLLENNVWGTESATSDLAFKMYSGEITELEEHRLLANTTLAAGTALQNFLTKWDPTEWSGVTNTYNHQIDSSASNTSVVEIDGITSAAQVSGSVVTSPNRYGTSSAMTMPSSQNIDVKATTNSGSIFGSRIIVTSIKIAVASIPNKIYSFNQSVNRASTY